MTYEDFYEIAEVACGELGWKFRAGARRAAALAAVQQQQHGCGREAQIKAIEDTLRAHRIREDA